MRGHTRSPWGEPVLQGGGHQCDRRGDRHCDRFSLEWLLAGVREGLREEAVGRARAPSRARGVSSRVRWRSSRGRSPHRRVAQLQVRPGCSAGELEEQLRVAVWRSLGQWVSHSGSARVKTSPRMPEEPRPAEPAEESAGKDTELTQCAVCREPQRRVEACTRYPFAMVLGAGEGLLALSVCREQPSTPTGEALGCTWGARKVWNAAAVYMVPLHDCCFVGFRWTFWCAIGEVGGACTGAGIACRPWTSPVHGQRGSLEQSPLYYAWFLKIAILR